MRPALLTANELSAGLSQRPQWTRAGNSIVRSIGFSSFPVAIEAVNRIAVEAERLDHHPDIDVRWRTLHITLSTHDVAGLTHLDHDLAQQIDAIAHELGAV